MPVFAQAIQSVIYFYQLFTTGQLHLRYDRLGQRYLIDDGKTYAIFRETISDHEYPETEVTLVIAFRLKLIENDYIAHWLFQRLSLLDTPVWVGFKGFRLKFWMVEPKTNDYLGLYRYQGRANAQTYAHYITAILRPVSVPNSVWYKIIEQPFAKYTTQLRDF